MTVYVLQRECGDYYCGCGGGHIIGVFSTEEQAKAVHDSLFDTITAVELDEARQFEQPKMTGTWT